MKIQHRNMKYKNILRLTLMCVLLTPLSALHSFAQEADEVISGTVSDALGPIMQANVVEIDNANRIVSSTTTDMNGNFSFKIKSPKNKLRFSFVGCKPKTVPIRGTVYDITLDDETTLTEVTVVSKGRGNGSGLAIPHNELSTSNQTISTKEFEGMAFTTIDEALQGRIAGLDIVGGGNLGSGTSMRLRGVSSINGSSEPLIVVDGNVWESDRNNSIDFSSANDEKFAELLNVNPEDIESISVLKDAAATAIWGSQGANGVIEIKLKRGSRGKTRVGYSYRLTGTWQPKGYKMLTGDEYTMLQKEAYFNPKLSSGDSDIPEFNYSSGTIGWQNYAANTDWISEVQQTGWRQNHYFSLTGGGEKANFRIGAGYDHETGSIIKQALDRLTTRVALDYFVSDRIKIISNLAFTYTKNQKNLGFKHNNTQYDNLLTVAYRYMPNLPIWARDDNGNDLDYYFNVPTTVSNVLQDQVGLFNPVALANLAKKEDTSYKISPEFQLVYNLLGVEEGRSQLKYEGKIVFDIFNNYVDQFLPGTLNVHSYTSNANNWSNAYAYKSLGITTTHTLTFTPHFKNEDHSMMMMLRGQLTDGTSTTQNTTVYGLPTGTIHSTGAEAVIENVSSTAGQWRSLYLTYSVHYAYKSRYMADFSIRRDGSTKFGPDNRWGTFPAFSLRWNISSEPWVKEKLPWLSMLSVRPGVGIVGTQPGDEGLYYSRYGNGSGYMGEGSTHPLNVQLSQLKWEEKKTWNLGFDFGFFNDKITGNIDLYRQYTSDLLMKNRKIATSAGYTQLAWDNVGKMENVGWEFNINTNNLIKFGKLGIDLNVTFANNRNVITEMDETCLRSLNNDFNHRNGSYLTRVEIDKPFGAIYGFRYKGVYQYTDYTANEIPGVSGPNAPVARDAMGNVVTDDKGIAKPMTFCFGTSAEYEFKGGDAIYEDINNDGTINELDIVYLGSSLPKITGGFGVKFKFGRWTLNNQFNFRYGNKIINANRMNAENMYTNANQSRAVNHRWRVEGDIAEVPRALHQAGYNWLGSDRFVEDGSFLRLNYVQLSYSFPTKIIKKLGMSQLSVNVSAQNVFCITKYSGADPEVSYGGYGVVTDNAQTPRAKSITGGITIQF